MGDTPGAPLRQTTICTGYLNVIILGVPIDYYYFNRRKLCLRNYDTGYTVACLSESVKRLSINIWVPYDMYLSCADSQEIVYCHVSYEYLPTYFVFEYIALSKHLDRMRMRC